MIVVAQDGSGHFSSVQAAVDSIPGGDRAEPVRILVRKGEYRERVIVDKSCIRITGENPEGTVIVRGGCAKDLYPDGTEKGTFLSATMIVTGHDVTVESLTVCNDAGDGRDVGQAVAVYAAGDRGIWRNCRLLAHQDTLFCGPVRLPNMEEDIGGRTCGAEAYPRVEDGPVTRSRLYFEKCFIRGDVDFIFGPYRCWFEDCTLFMNERGGWYTASNASEAQPYGFVFHRCRLTGECGEGKAYLGRPWRKGSAAVFLACEMDGHVAPEGFTDWDAERVVTGRCGEWRTSGARADQGLRHPSQKRLEDFEAGEITLLRVLGGTDGWQPAPEQEQ